ncbi:MAG: polysaccharide biosynthesis protein, partial [uncultured bacterium]
FVGIYYRFDTMMISWMKGEKEVGLYNAPYNIIMGLSIVSSSFLQSVFPNISRFFKDSIPKLIKGFKRSLIFMGISGLTIATVGTIFAKQIIYLIYSSAYSESVVTFKILIWSLFFIFLSSTTGVTLNAMDKQKWSLISTTSMAVINIVLNYFLIKSLGINGAAITNVITYLYGFILMGTVCLITINKKRGNYESQPH